LFFADNLMKPHGLVWVVRLWHSVRTDPIQRCFDDPKGLSCGDLLVGVVPELSSCLMV
jgi:hypothetical protein